MNLFQCVRSLRDYRELLSKVYGIYARLEPVLWRALAPLAEPLQRVERQKSRLRSGDLTVCGVSGVDITALPRWQRIAPFPSRWHKLWAGLRARRRYPWRPGDRAPLANCWEKRRAGFFHSYGAEGWRQFRSVLAQQVRTRLQQEAAIGAASDTFEIFDCWMNGEEKTQWPLGNRQQ